MGTSSSSSGSGPISSTMSSTCNSTPSSNITTTASNPDCKTRLAGFYYANIAALTLSLLQLALLVLAWRHYLRLRSRVVTFMRVWRVCAHAWHSYPQRGLGDLVEGPAASPGGRPRARLEGDPHGAAHHAYTARNDAPLPHGGAAVDHRRAAAGAPVWVAAAVREHIHACVGRGGCRGAVSACSEGAACYGVVLNYFFWVSTSSSTCWVQWRRGPAPLMPVVFGQLDMPLFAKMGLYGKLHGSSYSAGAALVMS